MRIIGSGRVRSARISMEKVDVTRNRNAISSFGRGFFVYSFCFLATRTKGFKSVRNLWKTKRNVRRSVRNEKGLAKPGASADTSTSESAFCKMTVTPDNGECSRHRRPSVSATIAEDNGAHVSCSFPSLPSLSSSSSSWLLSVLLSS